jgi:PAS domain S-box-containing protein
MNYGVSKAQIPSFRRKAFGRWMSAVRAALDAFKVAWNTTDETPPQTATAQTGNAHLHAVMKALGVAVYTTDAAGRITHFNEAAAALWGYRPALGEDRWCGSWRLCWPDGTPMRHDECPMAIALREGRSVRGGEAVAERPDGTRIPFAAYPTPLHDEAGAIIGAINVLVDITERKAAEAALADSEAHLRAVFETTPECIKLVSPDGRLLQMNPAGLCMVEADTPADVEGRSIFNLIAPEDRAAWQANHDRVCGGEALNWEFTILGRRGIRRRMETHAAPLRLPDGQMSQLAITRDVTARREAEQRQTMLAREVDHRAKNVLALALSLVRLTRAEDPRRFAQTVEGRIAALAHAHTLLAQEGWSGAELRAIAKAELAAYHTAGRVALHGPPLVLIPGAVQPVAMVLHELVTNAAKYGALSAPNGRVELDWAVQADNTLLLTWSESGGPAVTVPQHQGFGSKLIETMVCKQLDGAVHQHWRAEGLRCKVTITADRLLPRGDAAMAGLPISATTKGDGAPTSRAELAGRRVLLAEDEALVALEFEETLHRLGCEVIGPAGTVEEVLHLIARAGRIDAAVLDVNLAGRPSFPAADILAKRGVPVIFATGYGDLPDRRAAGGGKHVLLRKPLEHSEFEMALLKMMPGTGTATTDTLNENRRSGVTDA